MEKFDTSKIDNVIVEDIYMFDAPDFVDAFIASADYNGVKMTEQELDILNEDSEFVYSQVENTLY
jgi:hypothetical protein